MERRIGSAGRTAAAYAGELLARHTAAAAAADGPPRALARAPSGEPASTDPGAQAAAGEMPFQAERPGRPALHFALPVLLGTPLAGPEAPRSGGGKEPDQAGGETGTGKAPSESGAEGGAAPAGGGAAQVDARAVADRVYELMRQEVLLARRRGVGGRTR